ncbi:ACT domain-containing protein ACR9-like isoform X2 [Nicotiana tomentosiformis]|uniref:ACT domain-containing protein ACR9-like isoform X2 n=1 Tax=Nicotiana tomentosiformis TaxID=4098 RepID=UPI00144648E3|nr:ACT domain-containing protein ACR9-like isoform X2 [Nicotiana tomentosiformis]
MGLPTDDAVVIQKGKKAGEPYVITVNCPDKTGLGCDICYTILDFGLYIIKGDGIWCYVILWVVPHASSPMVRWANLKERLLSVCPSCSVSFYLTQPSPPAASSPVYLLTFCSHDRRGLLHDVTQVLCELELTIQRVKVTTTPDGRVLDLFFITDNLELLHTKERQDETYKQLHAVLGQSFSCELQLAGSQFDNLQCVSSLSPSVAEELFRCELSDNEFRTQALSPDMMNLKRGSVTIDNSMSPAHTLLQIDCVDHKGFLYDIMRTLKDCNIQIAYGRFSAVNKGQRELDLFIRQKDGKKIVDPDKQDVLCSRLKAEMLHPLRVIITNRGPDTELLVANPVELSGKGRPRVFYDVTLAMKTLGICIFSLRMVHYITSSLFTRWMTFNIFLQAEIGRHCTSDLVWEVYRFLLDENCRFDMSCMVGRNQIVDKVRRTLMGW